MISIFNGKSRTLGGSQRDICPSKRGYAPALKFIQGASLAVFMAISLHADADGFAFPSVPLLCRETGYNEDTIFKALSHLRELRIAFVFSSAEKCQSLR